MFANKCIFKNRCFITINVITASGKDHHWLLKPLGYFHSHTSSLYRWLTHYKGEKVILYWRVLVENPLKKWSNLTPPVKRQTTWCVYWCDAMGSTNCHGLSIMSKLFELNQIMRKSDTWIILCINWLEYNSKKKGEKKEKERELKNRKSPGN